MVVTEIKEMQTSPLPPQTDVPDVLLVDVTQRHIYEAKLRAGHCWIMLESACPIALAACDALWLERGTICVSGRGRFTYKERDYAAVGAEDFVRAFDRSQPVRPATFLFTRMGA